MTFATWIFDTTRTPQRRRAIDGVLMLATVSVGCVDDTVPSVDGSTASTTSTGAATTTGPTPTSTTDGLDSTLGGPPSTTTTTDDPSTSTTRGSTDTGTSSGTSSTDTGTSSGSGTTTGSGSSESTAGLPPAPCLTVSCDGICCPAGDECINDSCVPICVSEVRCGPNLLTCCPEADVCLDDVCVTPGASCNDSYDCAVAQFCEPTLDQCLPQPQPNACEFVPSFVDVDPLLQWSWEEDEIETIPVVGDIDGDGLPEVIFSTRSATDPNGASLVFFGEIVVLDGTTGLEQFRVQQDPNAGSFGSYSRTTPGIADVDGNGLADIVYAGRPEIFIPPFANNSSRIHAVNGLGQHLWSSHAPDGSPYYIFVRNGAPVFANLDADDASEIIFGTAVIDDDGTVVFDQNNGFSVGGGVFGSNGDVLGGLTAVADLTGDGFPEIISGHQAWTVSWNAAPPAPPVVQLSLLWEHSGPDGYPAVADLDGDGAPEVVLVGDPAPFMDPDGAGPLQRDGQLQVLDGLTGQLWCGVDPTDAVCQANAANRTQPLPLRPAPGIVGGGRGGPPVVADFDGDGRQEIAVAGSTAYTVYDLNRPGEVVVQPAGDPPPALGALYTRWTSTTQDTSRGTTGSSAYDFQGDGIAEVLHADQCYLRVYDGADGTLVFEADSPNLTNHEYPLVADIDADGHAELLVVASDEDAAVVCTDPGYMPRRGLFAYRHVDDQWVRTRPVWNTHTYHVTNSTSLGLTPVVEPNNWDDPRLDGYRTNFLGAGIFNAPNLEVGLSADLNGCPVGEVQINATVHNTGSLSVPPGIELTLYRGVDASGVLVSTLMTAVGLPPGGQTTVGWTEPSPGNQSEDYYVEVDDGEVVTECAEADNAATTLGVTCTP